MIQHSSGIFNKLMTTGVCLKVMIYAFTILFAAGGIYFIIKGIRLRLKLDRRNEDYDNMRKKSYGLICGGLLLIIIGLIKFYTRLVLWGWT